jgi:hypothetical protein
MYEYSIYKNNKMTPGTERTLIRMFTIYRFIHAKTFLFFLKGFATFTS